jgi:hypothetical protein
MKAVGTDDEIEGMVWKGKVSGFGLHPVPAREPPDSSKRILFHIVDTKVGSNGIGTKYIYLTVLTT